MKKIIKYSLLIVLLFIIAYFAYIAFYMKDKFIIPKEYSKSKLVYGSGTIRGARGFSFSKEQQVEGEGDINFKNKTMDISVSYGKIVDLGSVPISSVKHISPNQLSWKNSVPVIKGHTYCIWLQGPLQHSFTKLCLDDTQKYENYGILAKPGSITFSYVTQLNGAPAFVPPPPPPPQPESRIEILRKQTLSMSNRISVGIPHFKKQLIEQFNQIQTELQTCALTSVRNKKLQEQHEIARLLLATDKYDKECKRLMAEIQAAERTWERNYSREKNLGTISPVLVKEINSLATEVSQKLEVELGYKMEHDVIEELLIEKKIHELKQK